MINNDEFQPNGVGKVKNNLVFLCLFILMSPVFASITQSSDSFLHDESEINSSISSNIISQPNGVNWEIEAGPFNSASGDFYIAKTGQIGSLGSSIIDSYFLINDDLGNTYLLQTAWKGGNQVLNITKISNNIIEREEFIVSTSQPGSLHSLSVDISPNGTLWIAGLAYIGCSSCGVKVYTYSKSFGLNEVFSYYTGYSKAVNEVNLELRDSNTAIITWIEISGGIIYLEPYD